MIDWKERRNGIDEFVWWSSPQSKTKLSLSLMKEESCFACFLCRASAVCFANPFHFFTQPITLIIKEKETFFFFIVFLFHFFNTTIHQMNLLIDSFDWICWLIYFLFVVVVWAGPSRPLASFIKIKIILIFNYGVIGYGRLPQPSKQQLNSILFLLIELVKPFSSSLQLSWLPKGTEMEVHEWTGMECYRGRGASGS